MKDKIKIFLKAFAVAFTACMVAMTQGDLSVLAVKHFVDAGQTGSITGVAMVLASFLPFQSQWLTFFLVGFFTTVVDSFAHMAMFPYEAVATGFGAMMLAIISEKFIFKKEIPT